MASIPKIDETTVQFSLRLDNILDWVRSVRSEHSSEQVLWVKIKFNYSHVFYIAELSEQSIISFELSRQLLFFWGVSALRRSFNNICSFKICGSFSTNLFSLL